MTNKFLLLLFYIVLLSSLASANLGIYKQGDTISVRGNLNTASSNITIYYPNTTIAVNNQPMIQQNGDIWNYSFSNTNTLGVHIYDYCDQNGNNCKENFFTITSSGVKQNPVFENTEFIILLVLALVFIILGVGLRFPSIGFIGSILLILLGIQTMIYGFNNVTSLYTRGAAGSIIGLGIIFMFISAYEWLPWGSE